MTLEECVVGDRVVTPSGPGIIWGVSPSYRLMQRVLVTLDQGSQLIIVHPMHLKPERKEEGK